MIYHKAHSRHILKTYTAYYEEVRTHLTLDKEAPNCRRSQTVGPIVAIPVLGVCVIYLFELGFDWRHVRRERFLRNRLEKWHYWWLIAARR
jgi:hypothetical protein